MHDAETDQQVQETEFEKSADRAVEVPTLAETEPAVLPSYV